jgi:hypothetical protein
VSNRPNRTAPAPLGVSAMKLGDRHVVHCSRGSTDWATPCSGGPLMLQTAALNLHTILWCQFPVHAQSVQREGEAVQVPGTDPRLAEPDWTAIEHRLLRSWEVDLGLPDGKLDEILLGKRPPRLRPISTSGLSIAERARRYLERMEPAISGAGGHRAAFKAALTLIRGFGLEVEEALPLLEEWNGKCEPPWAERDLVRKLTDALKNGRMRMGKLLDGGPR